MGSTSTAPLFLLTITFMIYSLSAQHGSDRLSALVIGTVFCDTCSHQRFSAVSHFISGATIAIECGFGKSMPNFKQVVQTNTRGEFKVKLPFSVHHHARRIKRCTVSLVKSSEPDCSIASMAVSSTLKLKSRYARNHVFSAGVFTFKPLQQPKLCNQQPAFTSSRNDLPSYKRLPTRNPLRKLASSTPALVSSIKKQSEVQPTKPIIEYPTWFLPPTIPLLPSPPSFPFPLPPNPFQPPPFLPIPSPPNPFQPPPLFNYPNPFHPPSYFPPIPFFNPPPPPPFFSFPPFPFPNPFHPPSPLIPGIPPAAPTGTGKKEETTHV